MSAPTDFHRVRPWVELACTLAGTTGIPVEHTGSEEAMRAYLLEHGKANEQALADAQAADMKHVGAFRRIRRRVDEAVQRLAEHLEVELSDEQRVDEATLGDLVAKLEPRRTKCLIGYRLTRTEGDLLVEHVDHHAKTLRLVGWATSTGHAIALAAEDQDAAAPQGQQRDLRVMRPEGDAARRAAALRELQRTAQDESDPGTAAHAREHLERIAAHEAGLRSVIESARAEALALLEGAPELDVLDEHDPHDYAFGEGSIDVEAVHGRDDEQP